MGVTNYYWAGDMLLGESGPNGKVDYLTDALGSVTTTVNGTGAVLNEYRYKPYGAQLSKTGTAARFEPPSLACICSNCRGEIAINSIHRRTRIGYARWQKPNNFNMAFRGTVVW